MSWRRTSAIRRSRTVLAAVSIALRAAASHDSLLTPMTSVTRYTLSAMDCSSPRMAGRGGVLPEHDRRLARLARPVQAHLHPVLAPLHQLLGDPGVAVGAAVVVALGVAQFAA